MATLYEIEKDYLAVAEMVEDPNIDPQTILDTLEGIEGELKVKADNYCIIIKKLDATEGMLDEEIKRLTNWKNTVSRNKANMKEAVKNAILMTGETKKETDHFKLSVAKNGGKQPLEITGEVPERFWKIIYDVDKDAIRKAIENGETFDFARLGERGTHLNIR